MGFSIICGECGDCNETDIVVNNAGASNDVLIICNNCGEIEVACNID